MPTIQPLDPATATGDAATHLATAKAMFGAVPNMFRTVAHAPAALGAMLGFFASLSKASLGPKVGEQIAVAVAQANSCGYCLAAHTAIGGKHGLAASELTAARSATASDPKTTAILELALAINATHGRLDAPAREAAHRAGISNAEVLEVIAHVALNIFTNSVNNVAGTPIDFPVVAPELAA